MKINLARQNVSLSRQVLSDLVFVTLTWEVGDLNFIGTDEILLFEEDYTGAHGTFINCRSRK